MVLTTPSGVEAWRPSLSVHGVSLRTDPHGATHGHRPSDREPGRGWDAGSTIEDGSWHGAVLDSAKGELTFQWMAG